jgi:hypothetical protein
VETWPSKACARCSAASACCSAASARARAAASRSSEASICAYTLILSSATRFTARMPTPREWFGFRQRTSAKCSTIGTGAEEIFSWCVPAASCSLVWKAWNNKLIKNLYTAQQEKNVHLMNSKYEH